MESDSQCFSLNNILIFINLLRVVFLSWSGVCLLIYAEVSVLDRLKPDLESILLDLADSGFGLKPVLLDFDLGLDLESICLDLEYVLLVFCRKSVILILF